MASKLKNDPTKSAKLTAFHDRIDDEMTISRFNWSRSGEPRESMEPYFAAKVRPPSGQSDDPAAAAVHVLLPGTAPQDYADLDFLVRHYQASLPVRETIAFVQVTLRFPDAANLHAPFEIVRHWVRAEFCADGLPAAVILHNPAIVGCANVGHVHVMIFPRKVTHLGWSGMVRDLASDAGRKAIWMSWRDYWEAAN